MRRGESQERKASMGEIVDGDRHSLLVRREFERRSTAFPTSDEDKRDSKFGIARVKEKLMMLMMIMTGFHERW